MRERDFPGLSPRLARWLDYEQTVNDGLFNDRVLKPFDERSNTVRREFYPELRPVWEQEFTWVPNRLVRRFGQLDREIEKMLGVKPRPGFTPLFLHPQTYAPHQRFAEKFGRERLPALATPTSSYRSVVVWDSKGRRAPALLKLSIGAIIAWTRRALRENQVARGSMISALFDTISRADRRRLQLDWFSEPAGMIEIESRHGWLLRRVPEFLLKRGQSTLAPTFSLISRRGSEPPLLVEWIRQKRRSPGKFVLEQLIEPYVKALAHLFFEEGLQYEGHPQNVLWELNRDEQLTGRIVLRDLADSSVNLSLRLAQEKSIPVLPKSFIPKGVPFPVAGETADYRTNAKRWRILRGFDTVERYGLSSFVWAINKTLAKHFRHYDSLGVERRYLELWQNAAVASLRVRPLFRKTPKGIATDEAMGYYLSQVDWPALGAKPAQLPDSAEALMIEGKMRKRRGDRYLRLECPWGEIFIRDGTPGFFRPAF